jgi:ABC-type sugar transport system permease subunit
VDIQQHQRVWLVTNGGEPNNQTHILVSYVYEAAFSAYRFGWAAALSMVIFAILFLFTQVLIKPHERHRGGVLTAAPRRPLASTSSMKVASSAGDLLA